MNDFIITECTTDKIIVNREPQNVEEETMMRLAAQDAIMRQLLSDSNQIQYKEKI